MTNIYLLHLFIYTISIIFSFSVLARTQLRLKNGKIFFIFNLLLLSVFSFVLVFLTFEVFAINFNQYLIRIPYLLASFLVPTLLLINAKLVDQKYFYKDYRLRNLIYPSALVLSFVIVLANLVILLSNNFIHLYILLNLIFFLSLLAQFLFLKKRNELTLDYFIINIFFILSFFVFLSINLFVVDKSGFSLNSFSIFAMNSFSLFFVSTWTAIIPISNREKDVIRCITNIFFVTVLFLPAILYSNILAIFGEKMSLYSLISLFIMSLIVSLIFLKSMKELAKDFYYAIMNFSIYRKLEVKNLEELKSFNLKEIVNHINIFLEELVGTNVVSVFSISEKNRYYLSLKSPDIEFVNYHAVEEFYLEEGLIGELRLKSFITSNEFENLRNLNFDILIPVEYESEIRFIIALIFSHKFLLERKNSISYMDRIVRWIKISSESALLKHTFKAHSYNALLYVRDNNIRQDITSLLISNGFEVFSVKSYSEAKKVFETFDIDLVFMDEEFDDGLKTSVFIREIRRNLEKSNTYCILVTKEFSNEFRDVFIESLADFYFVLGGDKVTMENFISSIVRNLEMRKGFEYSYRNIKSLTQYSRLMLNRLYDYRFVEIERLEDDILHGILLNPEIEMNMPSMVIIGKVNDTNLVGRVISSVEGRNILLEQNLVLPLDFYSRKTFGKNKTIFDDYRFLLVSPSTFSSFFAKEIRYFAGEIANFIATATSNVFVIALNYKRKINLWDVDLLNSVVTSYTLLKEVYTEIKEIDEAFIYTMQSLARAAEEMDEETANHIYRVGEYSRTIAEYMGFGKDFSESIYYSSQMHDIGKLRIPREILRKPGSLTYEEFEIMKEHTIAGAIILGDHPKLSMARDIALSHHEKYDGSGYPYGISGNSIPISARIVAIADIYDALRSPRVYKPPLEHEASVEIITKGNTRTKPSHFDPEILEVFRQIHDKFYEIYKNYEQ